MVLGVAEVKVVGATGDEVAQVVQGSLENPIPVAGLATAGTRAVLVVATAFDDLGRR
jgi:hypothetical protein